MRKDKNLEKGFTLVELMVAMVIGLVTLGAALALYLTIFTGSMTTIRSARLNHDIDSAMTLITNELRRAGFNGNAVTGGCDELDSDTYCVEDNPFQTLDISTDRCVLYTYDDNANGVLDGNEQFGFMLANKTLFIRIDDLDGSSPSCDAGSNTGDWVALTIATASNESLDIEDFSITDDASWCVDMTNDEQAESPYLCKDSTVTTGREVKRHFLEITIDGHPSGDYSIIKRSIAHVVVANDQVIQY